MLTLIALVTQIKIVATGKFQKRLSTYLWKRTSKEASISTGGCSIQDLNTLATHAITYTINLYNERFKKI